MTFMLDVGGTYDRPEALRVGRAVEELGFEWYEEPLPHYDLEGYRELSRDLDIPVIGAETVPGGFTPPPFTCGPMPWTWSCATPIGAVASPA